MFRRMFGRNQEPSPEEDAAGPPDPVEAPATPFDVPMTPRQTRILDFGWEIMKHSNTAHLFLWLEADGWQGGHELLAWQHGPGQVAVKIKPWETLTLVAYQPNSQN